MTVRNGIITVTGIADDALVIIYDLHGRIVFKGTSHVINGLSAGLYVVKSGEFAVKISI